MATSAAGRARCWHTSRWSPASLISLLALLTLLLSFLAAALLLGWVFSAPSHRGAASDHFDGRRFRNRPATGHGVLTFFRWQLHREKGSWRKWTEAPPGPRPPESVDGGALRATFVNHSTVLLQMDGMNVLTDPVWSDRVSPVYFAGPKRHRPPGIRFDDLPPIHLVLISHNHYDHLDLTTVRRLEERGHPLFVVPLGVAAFLRQKGIENVVEVDWWKESGCGQLHITAVPAQHFSSRGFFDRDATLWCGYVVEGPSGRIYFAGDTGFGPHFEEIGKRFDPLRLALLPIAAYRPRWFMHPVHMAPDEAVAAHGLLRAKQSMAIHFGTFCLGDDGQEEPAAELRRALAGKGGFVVPEEGRGVVVE
jgi:L-ascorbate metabolism protein UlaG (beta-lactamase superfamily)